MDRQFTLVLARIDENIGTLAEKIDRRFNWLDRRIDRLEVDVKVLNGKLDTLLRYLMSSRG